MAGFIIAIDGPDGSGKTTQIELLKQTLEQKGLDVYTTRASGGTPIGQELRKASLSKYERSAEVDLYISLAMHTDLGQDLQERCKNNQVILVDRSPLSIIAYQNFGAQLKSQSDGYAAAEKMLRLWAVDLLLVFDIPLNILKARSDTRQTSQPDQTTNYFEVRDDAYKKRVHDGYSAAKDFALNLPKLDTDIQTINANQPIADIQQNITSIVLAKLTSL